MVELGINQNFVVWFFPYQMVAAVSMGSFLFVSADPGRFGVLSE